MMLRSVNIIVQSGNTYFMDGKGNITVNCSKDMSFVAGIILICQQERYITSIAGSNIHATASVNIVSSAGAKYG